MPITLRAPSCRPNRLSCRIVGKQRRREQPHIRHANPDGYLNHFAQTLLLSWMARKEAKKATHGYL